MTEEKATSNTCPIFAAVGLATVALSSKDIAGAMAIGARCIGSACMWGCDANGAWRGQCGLIAVPPIISTPVGTPNFAIPAGAPWRPIGKGVYSNPQPGDADHGE